MGAGEERGLVVGEDVPVGTVYGGGGGGEDGVIQRRQESDGGQVERRGVGEGRA